MNSPTAAQPEPDGKDWTWVLERPCPDCGFVATDFDVGNVGAVLRANAAQWVEVLGGLDVGHRPTPQTWSPLEYACHVRDVFEVYLGRLDRMLTEDGPRYANWDQDQTALDERYHEADPVVVARQVIEGADALAARFDTVTGAAWSRPGFRGDGADFTVDTFARYFIHDPIHHLWDVGRRVI